jgi:hypothetical protein
MTWETRPRLTMISAFDYDYDPNLFQSLYNWKFGTMGNNTEKGSIESSGLLILGVF